MAVFQAGVGVASGMKCQACLHTKRSAHRRRQGVMMKLAINIKSYQWWYWFITLIAMIVGLSGTTEGFYVVVLVSVIQFMHFTISGGFTAFATQVRFVYAIFTLIALFDPTRIFYWVLLVGTVMVTLFDRCIIARVLILMPWNRNVKLS